MRNAVLDDSAAAAVDTRKHRTGWVALGEALSKLAALGELA